MCREPTGGSTHAPTGSIAEAFPRTASTSAERHGTNLSGLLDIDYYTGDLDSAATAVIARALSGEGGYACFANVHVVVTAQREAIMRDVLSSAWTVFPDGAPIAWFQRYAFGRGERIPGPDLMPRVIELGQEERVSHFLFGSSNQVLMKLRSRLLDRFPAADIVDCLAPPFGEIDEEFVERIRSASPHVVWCALGAPKQELWMHQHAEALAPALLLGVGAAFDFVSENKPRAPRPLQGLGLEWLHRMMSEPRRLGPRYLNTNVAFGAMAIRELRRIRKGHGANGTPPAPEYAGPIAQILPLLGTRAEIVHGTPTEGAEGGGGDHDCVVERLDPSWPLRLPADWRLCQRLRYDVAAVCWVLDHAGEVVAVDTLDDRDGVGEYAFPTAKPLTTGSRAAYLTSKRIRKRITRKSEWDSISGLAAADEAGYRLSLRQMFGRRLGSELASLVLAGHVPPLRMRRRVVRRCRLRVWSRPAVAARALWLHATRVADRALHPTGLYVLVAGPDGVGKSTLAAGLQEACGAFFHRKLHLHWRPGLLPRPGSILGRAAGDVSRPHSRPPHGRLMSLALLGYYWLDFALGGLFQILPFRARTGLVVVERGWWDIAVDPARYRLTVSGKLVRLLGLLLPRPDVVLLLEASPAEVRARKDELAEDEIVRQSWVWRFAVPKGTNAKVVAGSAEKAIVSARAEVVARLEARAIGRLGSGWAGFPRGAGPRWLLPRGPRHVAVSGLRSYHPITRRARAGWHLGCHLARVGGLRLLPRVEGPDSVVRHLVAPYLPAGGTLALTASMSYPNRHVAVLLDSHGKEAAFAKLGLDEAGSAALAREHAFIERFERTLPWPLRAPEVIAADDGILVFRPVSWRPRARPWVLEPEVAAALGTFFSETGGAHGDCAPWNLMQTEDGWVLADWEDALEAAESFRDIFHYFVQSATLLGRPRWREIQAGLRGAGWIGAAVGAYAAAAGIDAADAGARFQEYLDARQETGGVRRRGSGTAPLAQL